MPNILEYHQQISLSIRLIPVCTLLYNRTFSVFSANSGKVIQSILFFLKACVVRSIYTLQNWICTKKHLQHTPEVPQSISIIIKSSKKEEKAVVKHLLHLHFQAFLGLFLLYSSLNPMAHGIS
jgi:hypothetical protein